MSPLIHATLTVTGDESLLEACDARIRLLLAEQPPDGEWEEHHAGQALCYDFKVRGGIPFPVFAQASQEFPALSIVAEWVDVGAGSSGRATIVEGRLTGHKADSLEMSRGSARPVHIAVAADGRLELALTLIRIGRDEWRAYALTAERDALLRVTRDAGGAAIDIWATEGSAEWSRHWRGSSVDGTFDFEIMEMPLAIAAADYGELEQMAREFVAEWVWFSSGRREEIAIEMDRYARYGYVVSSANLRSARLHRMRQEAADLQRGLQHANVDPEQAWVVDVIARCWAGTGSAAP